MQTILYRGIVEEKWKVSLTNFISKKLKTYLCGESPVIVCIGSDRITGDCLGPLSGQIMTESFCVPAYVYGTLENPVTALNLERTMEFVQAKHPYSKILAIDSCVGKREDIGSVRIFKGGLYPGSADGKNLPKVGDVSIIATVCDGVPSSAAFSSVRLGMIYSLSKFICQGIAGYFYNAEQIANRQVTLLQSNFSHNKMKMQ